MADVKERYSDNVEGQFFVDRTCINCDTCRQLAPQIFGEEDNHSFVFNQPQNNSDERDATRALLCCPTGSIGTIGTNKARETMIDLPLVLAENVFYCGFNSPKSYGGNSYFIQHEAGNWLIDSPKFLPHLVKCFEAMGGIKFVFLSHRDDVADAEKYAAHFKAARIIHNGDADSAPGAEIVLEISQGEIVGSNLHKLFEIDLPDIKIIPTPGHTRGHMVLLYKDTYLFTGDHLAFDREAGKLEAFQDFCWYSWPVQAQSMSALSQFRFTWVLPGHGQRVNLPQEEMHRQMVALVEKMNE